MYIAKIWLEAKAQNRISGGSFEDCNVHSG